MHPHRRQSYTDSYIVCLCSIKITHQERAGVNPPAPENNCNPTLLDINGYLKVKSSQQERVPARRLCCGRHQMSASRPRIRRGGSGRRHSWPRGGPGDHQPNQVNQGEERRGEGGDLKWD